MKRNKYIFIYTGSKKNKNEQKRKFNLIAHCYIHCFTRQLLFFLFLSARTLVFVSVLEHTLRVDMFYFPLVPPFARPFFPQKIFRPASTEVIKPTTSTSALIGFMWQSGWGVFWVFWVFWASGSLHPHRCVSVCFDTMSRDRSFFSSALGLFRASPRSAPLPDSRDCH